MDNLSILSFLVVANVGSYATSIPLVSKLQGGGVDQTQFAASAATGAAFAYLVYAYPSSMLAKIPIALWALPGAWMLISSMK